jgi:hypothetical protein
VQKTWIRVKSLKRRGLVRDRERESWSKFIASDKDNHVNFRKFHFEKLTLTAMVWCIGIVSMVLQIDPNKNSPRRNFGRQTDVLPRRLWTESWRVFVLKKLWRSGPINGGWRSFLWGQGWSKHVLGCYGTFWGSQVFWWLLRCFLFGLSFCWPVLYVTLCNTYTQAGVKSQRCRFPSSTYPGWRSQSTFTLLG